MMEFDDISLTLDVDGERSTVYGFDIERKEHPAVRVPEDLGVAYAYHISIPFIESDPPWTTFEEFRRPIPVTCIFERDEVKLVFDGAIVAFRDREGREEGMGGSLVEIRVPIDFGSYRRWNEEMFLNLLDWDVEPGLQPDEFGH